MSILSRSRKLIHGQGDTKFYLEWPVITSPFISQAKMKEPQTAASPLLELSVEYWWLMLDDCLLPYPPQVKHLWFQQKQVEADSPSVTERSIGKMGFIHSTQSAWGGASVRLTVMCACIDQHPYGHGSAVQGNPVDLCSGCVLQHISWCVFTTSLMSRWSVLIVAGSVTELVCSSLSVPSKVAPFLVMAGQADKIWQLNLKGLPWPLNDVHRTLCNLLAPLHIAKDCYIHTLPQGTVMR